MAVAKPSVSHARFGETPETRWLNPWIRTAEKVKPGGRQRKDASRRWRIPFEVLDVPLFDLLHEARTLEDVTTKIGRKLTRHFENLVMCDFRK